jgi:glycosyltransferase involved in cell wall biosynthesis
VGGVADVVKDMVTGRLVLPGNPEALARAIVEVLSDPSRRREMGVAGREFVAQYYGWERVLKEWEDTLIVARDRVSITV